MCACVRAFIYIYIYIYIYMYIPMLCGTDQNFVHLKQVSLQSGRHHRHLYVKDVVRSMARPKRNTHYM